MAIPSRVVRKRWNRWVWRRFIWFLLFSGTFMVIFGTHLRHAPVSGWAIMAGLCMAGAGINWAWLQWSYEMDKVHGKKAR